MNTATQPENRHSSMVVVARAPSKQAIKAINKALCCTYSHVFMSIIAMQCIVVKATQDYKLRAYSVNVLLCSYLSRKPMSVVKMDTLISGKRRGQMTHGYSVMSKLIKLGFMQKTHGKTLKQFGLIGYKYSLTLAGRAYCEELIKHYERELKKLANNKLIG